MEEYLVRALKDDVGVLQLINVVRIIIGKSMIHNGVSGEEHHGAMKVAARLSKESSAVTKIIDDSLSLEDVEVDEDVEIDEIISSYLKKD